MNSPYWFEVAVICGLTAVGTILLGHFEAGAPKWRRLAKLGSFCALSVIVSATAGRVWFGVMLLGLIFAVLVIHVWWLPRQGVHGWTGEPRDRYYRLRGWKLPGGDAG